MEGSLSAALGELDKLDRRASWHFSNPKSGPLLQHYETELPTWHAGYEANCAYIGIEHEGVTGQPLTEVQIANDVALLRWLAQQEGWPGFVRKVSLWEHNEFMATACPSGRIPWARIIEELEDTMSEAEKAELYVLRVLAGVQEALAQKRTQDAANGLKKYLGVVAQ
jgi:N-acetyl-anhydromuramyl-L-alanine amidase AmpD